MKPYYGVDAPNVVKSLFLLSLLFAILTWFSWLIQHVVWFWVAFSYTFSICLSLLITGSWMIYGTKVIKPRIVLGHDSKS